jgi:very-short-patch-repair endonuclease
VPSATVAKRIHPCRIRAVETHSRGRQLGGCKFVRQEPIDRYYVDFVCRERRLIVELDGGQHAQRAEDTQRDSKLCALGYSCRPHLEQRCH